MRWLSPKSRNVLVQLLTYIIVFLIGGSLYVIVERGLLGEALTYPSTGNPYDPVASVISILLASVLLGILLGTFELTLFRNLWVNRGFLFKISIKTVLYAIMLGLVIMLIAFPINSTALGLPWSDPAVIQTVVDFIKDFAFWSAMIYCAVFFGITLFIREMIDNIGFSQVINFFTGKYHDSVVEERVFMFLDMRSSTTIAERLGHQQYYRLLNRYYRDMTNAILETRGEIYQYVGDEIVVSWKKEVGLIENNCLKCFFEIKVALEKNAEFYEKHFNTIPEFKAGMHLGSVTTGEVGVIKKELLFTGDVLNVTARIQGLCNELESDLLISEELSQQLSLAGTYSIVDKGEFELRGRGKLVRLNAVNKVNP